MNDLNRVVDGAAPVDEVEATDAAGDGSDPVEKGRRLEKDIERIRNNLGRLMGELNNRRRAAFDVRLQLKRHPVRLAVGALTFIALVGGGVAVYRASRRPRHPRMAEGTRRLNDLREALAAKIAPPAKKSSPVNNRTVATHIAGAAGAAIASVLARRMVESLLRTPDKA